MFEHKNLTFIPYQYTHTHNNATRIFDLQHPNTNARTQVRRILWDEVNESPVKPEKSQSKRRPSLLLAAKRSARRRRESFQINGNDDEVDRKIDTSPVHKAARRSSIRRFGSRRGSMNSLRRLSKIAMKRSTRSLLGRISSSESMYGDEDSKS